MLVLLSITLPLFAAAGMLTIRVLRPGFAYHWLVAVAGGLFAWPLMLLAGLDLPQEIRLVVWQPETLFPASPTLLVDRFSWPYAAALGALVLAVVLTDVARAAEADWPAWAGSLLLASLGLIAVLAGNLVTLMLAWMAIDLTVLLIMLAQVNVSVGQESVVIAFSARVAGIVLLIAGAMVAGAVGQTPSQATAHALSFTVIPSRASVFLVLAAGLRLGVLPLHLPFVQEVSLRRGLGTISRLVPAVSSLILLARTATADEPPALASFLLVLSGLAALYGSAAWVLAADELDGRPAWILSVASFSVAAAVRSQPTASLAWGMAGLLSGGLIFLTSAHDRRLIWLSLFGLLGISALPYSPTWNGARLYEPPFSPVLGLFLLAHALLLAGYVRHGLRSGAPLAGVERWVWLIYPLGLLLLPTMHFLFALWTNPGLESAPAAGWWAGLLPASLAGLLVLWNPQETRLPREVVARGDAILSLNWLYSLLWTFYQAFSRLVGFITTVLEGEGGLLWAFLLLILLLSVLARNGA